MFRLCPRPICHALHILVLFFLVIFLVIWFTLPFSHSFAWPPPYDYNLTIHNPSFIPSSSISCCLDAIPISLLTRISTRISQRLTSPYNDTTLLISFILLLSGDIHVNPGPSTHIQFAHLNTRSISTVTADLDKPTILKEFIADENIEILALSETWLPPSPLPSTLASITPPNFSLIHYPRPVGKRQWCGLRIPILP